ncbi:MAG: DUF1801 domain-containing protein, partial [Candidatus Cloacimonetes bacterium]|nr:DUF1801 domain-containing protein [Candidatus Cloacimonadota bacterium]
MNELKPTPIDTYIAAAPAEVRGILERIRLTIRREAPGAEEILSYGMPAFRGNGVLVYFAAFKAHIGVYPPVSGDEELQRELAPFAGPKGNLKFPLDQPIPLELIARVVRQRLVLDQARRPSRRKA